MKTARFAEIVKEAGAPETYLLWVPPEKDKVFQRALKEHRVMTVHQENVGTKKDYGSVGFTQEAHAEYLIFPKSVRRFEGRRVVGINYELLSEKSRPGTKPVGKATKEPAWKRAAKPPPARDEKVVRFERPAEIAEPPKTKAKPAPKAVVEPSSEVAQRDAADLSWLPEVKRAVKELKAGKAVAAYERLAKLVEQAEG